MGSISTGRPSHVKVMLIAAVIHLFFTEVSIGGKISTELEMRRQLKSINKPAVKTIKSKCGSIIDCVDIWKQPAFDHLLLKNHTIQMKPSHFNGSQVSSKPLEQTWHESGSCPRGTIPIVRIQKSHMLGADRRKMKAATGGQENARIKIMGKHLHGGYGILNVWNVHVEPNEFSHTAIFVSDLDTRDLISAGWMVSPTFAGNNLTRLYAHWVADDNAGCYNHRCPGFVQTDYAIALGGPIEPLSTYGGQQYQISVKIIKDLNNDHWWLSINEKPIGYWPGLLFKNMKYEANRVEWGGQVYNTDPRGRLTTTQMGSGHLPDEGYGKAAFIRNALFYDEISREADPIEASHSIQRTNPGC